MEKPEVIMIAGANGSGKTSTAMSILPDFLRMNEFVNTDEIARGLSPFNPSSQAIEAGRLMLKRVDSLIKNKQSFAFETTAAGSVHLRTLSRCRDAGYHVKIIFFYLSNASIALARVKLRTSQGGHDVPEVDIVRRYSKGMKMLINNYIKLADIVEIYDNSSFGSFPIAKSAQGKWKLYNPKIWQIIQGYKND
ncbi:MAG: zeta toxin family protein [Pseudomonadota bacterium]